MAVAVKAIAILHRQPPVPVILTQRRAADLLNVGRKIVRGSSADGIDLSKSYFISSASKICRSSSTSVAGDETRDEEVFPITPLEVNQVKDTCSKWEWRGYTINYLKYEAQNDQKSNPPLLLVHGFGASVAHWRRNIPTLGQTNTVYAIDLLGFGASDKPPGFEYTMEAWAQLILDFVDEIVQRPTVLIGYNEAHSGYSQTLKESDKSNRNRHKMGGLKAVAVITGGENSVKGSLQFFQEANGVTHVSGKITGLKPGLHGFHIHALGDTTNGCNSTGPHFNPLKNDHGAPQDDVRHAGDLGNIVAGQDGVAEVSIKDKHIPLSGIYSILGRAVVIHADPDDLGRGGHELSKTTGNAGARVGCGVIGLQSSV